jgi:hypothetical protein
MSNRTTLDELTPAQAMRLIEYAKVYGPCWKSTLKQAWATGRDERCRDGALLRQIRNEKGPRWLSRLDLKGAPTTQMKD